MQITFHCECVIYPGNISFHCEASEFTYHPYPHSMTTYALCEDDDETGVIIYALRTKIVLS